jgi:hypothetical protein
LHWGGLIKNSITTHLKDSLCNDTAGVGVRILAAQLHNLKVPPPGGASERYFGGLDKMHITLDVLFDFFCHTAPEQEQRV